MNIFAMLDEGSRAALEEKSLEIRTAEVEATPPFWIPGLEVIHSRGIKGYKGCMALVVTPKERPILTALGHELLGKLLSTQRILTALDRNDLIQRKLDIDGVTLPKMDVAKFILPVGWDAGVDKEKLSEIAAEYQAFLMEDMVTRKGLLVSRETVYDVVDVCTATRCPELVFTLEEDGSLPDFDKVAERRLSRMMRETSEKGQFRGIRGLKTWKDLKDAAARNPYLKVTREGDTVTVKAFRSQRSMRVLPRNVAAMEDMRLLRMIVTDYAGNGDAVTVAYEVSIPALDDPDQKARRVLREEQVTHRVVGMPKLTQLRPSASRIMAENFAGIPEVFGLGRAVTNVLFSMIGEAFRDKLERNEGGGKFVRRPRPDEFLQSMKEIHQFLGKNAPQGADPQFLDGFEAFVKELEECYLLVRANPRTWLRDWLGHRCREAGFLTHGGMPSRHDVAGLQEALTSENFWTVWPLLVNLEFPQLPELDDEANKWLSLLVGQYPNIARRPMIQPYRYTGEVLEQLVSTLEAEAAEAEEEQGTIVEVEAAAEAPVEIEVLSGETPIAEIMDDAPEILEEEVPVLADEAPVLDDSTPPVADDWITPMALMAAEKAGLDLETLKNNGTGKDGRVVMNDVHKAVKAAAVSGSGDS